MTVTLIPEVDRAITKRKTFCYWVIVSVIWNDYWFEADSVLTVGFTNESEPISERYGAMKEKYDVIIEGDSVAPLLTCSLFNSSINLPIGRFYCLISANCVSKEALPLSHKLDSKSVFSWK